MTLAVDEPVPLRSETINQQQFRGAFENAPFGMCLVGLDGRILQANAALCRMLQYSAEELLAAEWSKLVSCPRST